MSRGPLDPRLLRHARSSRTGIAALAALGAGQAGATLLLAVALTATVTGERTLGITLIAVAYAVRALCAAAEQVVTHRTAARVTAELRDAVPAAALRRGPAWVARYGSGRLTAVLTGGLDALRPWFGGYLPALVLGVALPPLVLVAMAVVDPTSAVVALLTLPLIPLLGALIGWATEARAKQRWAADARLAGHFLDVVRGLGTLRVYGRAERQIEVVAAMTERHRAATLRVLRVAFLSSTALDLVGTLSVGLIAVEVGLRVAAGDLALAPALLVILLAPEVYRPLREMAARYHAGADAGAVIDDVDDVLSGAPDPRPATEDGAPAVTATGLRVRHPDADTDALVLDRLDVRAGELVALCGPSGAGKTTALRVLAGLQPVDAGAVAVHGTRPLYLPQHPTLPHARTVRDALGPVPDGEVRDALRTVGLDTELTPGTPLGEHGRGVSAGQRQRLALAALLWQARQGAITLLLDEPTAHLDPAAEAAVTGELRAAAARGCAVLVVAHRPALPAAADRVVRIGAVQPRRAGGAAAAPRTDPQQPDATTTARSTDPQRCDATTTARSTDPHRPGRVVAALRRPGTAVVLGAASWLAGIVLTGAAAWLLVRAADLPPVLTLSTAVVLVRGSAVARPLLRYLERLVSHDVAFARLGERRARVYADLIPRVPGPRARRRGDLLSRVVDDVDAQIDGLLRGRLPAAAAGLALLLAGGAAVLVRPALAAPLLAGVLIAGVAAPLLGARLTARRDAATGRARAELRDAVVETVDGLEELAARDGDAALDVLRRRIRHLERLEARAARAAGLAAGLGHLGWGVAVAGAALATAPGGGLSPQWAAVLLLGVVALGEPVAALPDAALARQRAAGATTRLAELTAGPPPVRPAVDPSAQQPLPDPWSAVPDPTPAARDRTPRGRGPSPAAPVGGGVVVRGLVAGWDPDRPPALDGLDLTVPPGARVAVRGVSGSGKSTLAAVLARLLDPRGGTVRLGGADLRTLPDATVRAEVALVGDDSDHVFASTVRENLRLAAPGATDAELAAVLRRVGLGDWGKSLDTWLGTGGATMSGGQRKRLATARALLAGPRLLILDEPTEGIDEQGAQALMADLLDAAAGRTVLVLTHRTEGLDRVDAIYELSAGQAAGVRGPVTMASGSAAGSGRATG